MQEYINRYAKLITGRPSFMALVIVFITIVAIVGASMMKNESMDYADMLPAGEPAVDAINKISDDFGSSGTTATIVLTIDPEIAGSDEIYDIRDPEVAQAMDILEQKVLLTDGVLSVSSYSSILKAYNSGRIPNSMPGIISIIESTTESESAFSNYVSDDYSTAKMVISLSDMNDDELNEFVVSLKQAVDETPLPAGISVGITGDAVISYEMLEQVAPTMQKTSSISMLSILVVVCVLFLSVRYGLISLMGIVFGMIWVYGFMGLFGMGMNTMTSGGMSMIMGIGIDFGIQIVNRFRQERKLLDVSASMANTLSNTIYPMFITTIAALIGFRAMSLGELTMLSELGNMMSLGILACFFAAISVVPVLLVISEKLKY